MVCIKICVLYKIVGTFMKFWYFSPFFLWKLFILNVFQLKYAVFWHVFFLLFFEWMSWAQNTQKTVIFGQKVSIFKFLYDNFNRVLVPKSQHIQSIRVVFFWRCWKLRFLAKIRVVFCANLSRAQNTQNTWVMWQDSVIFADLHMLIPFIEMLWSTKQKHHLQDQTCRTANECGNEKKQIQFVQCEIFKSHCAEN